MTAVTFDNTPDGAVTVLNELNRKLTEIQRLTVAVLTGIQNNTVQDVGDVLALGRMYGSVLPTITQVNDSLRDVTQRLLNPKAAEQQRLAAQREQLEAATQEPRTPTTRRRIADITDDIAMSMVGQKLGPQYETKLREERKPVGTDLGMPTLEAAAKPAVEQPTLERSAADQVADAENAELLGLIDLAIGDNGLFARWFHSTVYPKGKGVFKAVPGVNIYNSDLTSMPYDRVSVWPEGFYRNAKTSALQHLVRTAEAVAVIDFGVLMDEDLSKAVRGLTVYFHRDPNRDVRTLDLTVMDRNLIRSLIKDLNNQFTAMHQNAQ